MDLLKTGPPCLYGAANNCRFYHLDNNHMKKLVSIIVVMVMLGTPTYSFAQTTGTTAVSSQVQALLDQIKVLQAQVQALKTAQEQVVKAQGEVSQALKLLRSLGQGMSGDDVKALQVILAADTSIYPEGLITGFYGRLTSEAVKKFQKKHGIEMLGLVGPKTLKKLNEEADKLSLSQEKDESDDDNDGDKNDKKFCIPPGHMIAPGWLKKDKEEKNKISECKTLPYGIQKKLDDDNHVITDTVAPVISGVTTSNLRATTTSIVWITNEKSNSRVWFGTSTPLVLTLPATVSSGERVTGHNISLSGLATSTTYYYVVGSSDEKGNAATSSQNSFLTQSE